LLVKIREILPRDAILARYTLWPCICPSVCLSVCLSQCGVYQNGKTSSRKQFKTTPHCYYAHSADMDLWTRLWGKYHVPQNVFLVDNMLEMVQNRHIVAMEDY